eukprot:14159234-Heterocapsa_arctica.AAC.1
MFSHRKANSACHFRQGSDWNTAESGDGNPHASAPPPVQGNPDALSISDEYIRLTKRQEARRILLERKARAEAREEVQDPEDWSSGHAEYIREHSMFT